MSKNHDENKDLRLISRFAKVYYANKTIEASKTVSIGNKSWGRIDYLCHYCGWTFIWNNAVKVRVYANTDDSPKKKRREDKKQAKATTLTNKKKR